ncbi:glycosyl hydrolase family protein [Micromonospora sp. KC606]|uniref:RICIN domain-containing protein n=1 Tax=Micromonospora sp. KC606 TaxID=2530379 RepID=UPI00104D1C63|nr:RICIN domain-containing protein [Micromonospora sp. KC606]TDC85071.1 glycosyl hydrolase family protein [Micromonospora sp. KC606]
MRNARLDIRRFTALGAIWLFLAPALIFNVSTAQPASAADVPPNPLEKAGWVLDRHDEFNGSLDESLWITKYLESRTTEERSRARFGFRDNSLVLRIDDDQPTYRSGDPMKVSSIQTGQMTGLHKPDDSLHHTIPTIWKYTPQYGYFEIRAKSSARSGIHTAFWTVGRQDTLQQRGEIDIMEHPGRDPRSFLFSLHKWSDPNLPESQNSIAAGFDMTTDFHIYALEWTPTQIKLYVDNVLRRTINASPAYPNVFFLGIYENAGWTGDVNPSDPRPKEFVVDYFRAYRKAGDPGDSAVTLTSRHSGKCVDVVSASTADGAEVAQYGCSGGSNQRWEFQSAGNNYYRVIARHSGKCLDVDAASTANNARVIQWTCNSGQNQQWQVQDAGSGYVRLVARHSGKCLDVPSRSTADGTRLIQYTCGSGQNQQFMRSAA